MKKKKLNPAEFRIISENCIELAEDLYLLKNDRSDGIVMVFLYQADSKYAVHITTFKTRDNSMEDIRQLFTDDPYYWQMLTQAVR